MTKRICVFGACVGGWVGVERNILEQRQQVLEQEWRNLAAELVNRTIRSKRYECHTCISAGTHPTDLQDQSRSWRRSLYAFFVDSFVLEGGRSNVPLAANTCAALILLRTHLLLIGVVILTP